MGVVKGGKKQQDEAKFIQKKKNETVLVFRRWKINLFFRACFIFI